MKLLFKNSFHMSHCYHTFHTFFIQFYSTGYVHPYACPACGKKFDRRDNTMSHLKNFHRFNSAVAENIDIRHREANPPSIQSPANSQSSPPSHSSQHTVPSLSLTPSSTQRMPNNIDASKSHLPQRSQGKKRTAVNDLPRLHRRQKDLPPVQQMFKTRH